MYSFGVFLPELIGGRKAHGENQSNSVENLVLQVHSDSPKMISLLITYHDHDLYVPTLVHQTEINIAVFPIDQKILLMRNRPNN